MGMHMKGLVAQYGLVLVAAIIVGGEIGLPIFVPGEVALIVAGIEYVHSPAALAVAIAGFGVVDFAATAVLYLAARTGGRAVLIRVLARFGLGPERAEAGLRHWRERLGRRDAAVILVMRMVPVVRMYASLGAGLLRLPAREFTAGALPAALLWAAIPLAAGYAFGTQALVVEAHWTQALSVLLSALVALCAVWLVRRPRPA